MALIASLENLHWLITLSFLLIIVASIVIYKTSRKFVTYVILSLLLALALSQVNSSEHSAFYAGLLYVIFSAFSLLLIAQFWSTLLHIFHFKYASRYYGIIIMYGTIGSILGPIMVIGLINYSSKTMLSAIIIILLIVVMIGLHLAHSYCNHEPAEQPEVINKSKNSSSLLFASFILLYSLIATIFYYQQLEVAGNQRNVNPIMLFGMRDLVIGLLTLGTHFMIRNYNLQLVRLLSFMPFVSIWLVLMIGFLPTLIPVMSAIVIFRTGNFVVTKPGKELYYSVRPDMSRFKSIIDAAIYRGGDLLGIWLFAMLKYFELHEVMISLIVLPLVIIWYLISKKLSINVNS